MATGSWNPEDEATLQEFLKGTGPLSRLQFKMTLRQIEAQERLAESMGALAALLAAERGLVKLPETEPTRGPGRMRR